MAKTGPKPWELTPERLKKIEELADLGCSQENIARTVGLHPSTFSEFKTKFPEIDQAIKKGRDKGEEFGAGIIREIMNDPTHKQRLTATIFYLKTQHRWKDATEVEQNKDNLPGVPTFKEAKIEDE